MVRIMQAAAMAALALAVSAQPSKSSKSSKASPILTSAVLYDTAELFYDIYDRVYSTVAADAVAKAKAAIYPALPQDPVAEVCKLAKVDPQVVWSSYAKVQESTLHTKAVILEQTAKLEAPLLMVIDGLVDLFDRALPKHAGAIPRGSLSDFAVVVVFLVFALYLAFRLLRIAVKIAFSILCCLCCCGCCCCRSKGSKAPAKAAVSKGKAAAATTAAAKAAPKQVAKAGNKK